MLGTERAIEANLQHTGLATLLVQVVACPLEGVCTAAHHDDDIGSIGITNIVEEVVRATGESGDLVHVLLHHLGEGFVVRIDGLTTLEVDVFVLGCDLQDRVLGAHCPFAEAADILFLYQRLDLFIGDLLDLLQLVGGPETIEETEEGNLGLKGCQVGYQGHVHGLLYVARTGHGKAGIAAGHYVGMIAKDRKRLCCKRTGRDMKHGRDHFTGNLVHVGDHQQQSLTSCKRGGQSTSREGTMYGTGCASLGLHFHDLHRLSPQVLTSGAGP